MISLVTNRSKKPHIYRSGHTTYLRFHQPLSKWPDFGTRPHEGDVLKGYNGAGEKTQSSCVFREIGQNIRRIEEADLSIGRERNT